MGTWFWDALGHILFFVYMTGLQAGLSLIVGLTFIGGRAILGVDREPHPILAGIGCVILGAAAGAVSFSLHPRPFVSNSILQVAYLVAVPVFAGLLVGAWGQYRRRRQKLTSQLDTFTYGFLFSFAFGLVRFL